MRSMTGYAVHQGSFAGAQISAEFKSVNHRFFDLSLRVPSSLYHLDNVIREKVQQSVVRGKISCTITVSERQSKELTLNQSAITAAVKSLRAIVKKQRLDGGVTLSDVLKVPGIFSGEQDQEVSAEFEKNLAKCIDAALKKFIASREKEGLALQKDISKRVGHIQEILTGLNERKAVFIENYKAKFVERLNLMRANVTLDEDRIAKEAAFMLEKMDVTEELVRLQAHIDLFLQVVKAGDRECGKKLDFVSQEMNREANTIASKSQDTQIVHDVLIIKAEVEKIREQIQNIE